MGTRNLDLAALIFAAALFSPAIAAADEPSADALREGALADMQAKKYDKACPALKQSYTADPLPFTLFKLAECEELSGKIASAVRAYDDYLKAFDGMSPDQQKAERQNEQKAAARKEALERDLPKITLTLPTDAPEGTRVLRRAEGASDLVPIALNVPLPIDPGEHLVTVDAPGRPRWERRFFVQKGDKKTIELQVPPASKETAKPTRIGAPIDPVPAYLPELNPGISGRRVAAYVIGGVGVAGVLTGAVTGAIVWAQKKPNQENCDATRRCNPTGLAAANQARAMGIVSTVTWTVGLVGLATGIVLYVTEPAPRKLGVLPNQVIVGTAGPLGASMGMKWIW